MDPEESAQDPGEELLSPKFYVDVPAEPQKFDPYTNFLPTYHPSV